MLDVHPPHEAAHTWKDFFIHIATIVVGLLIAVGLEQAVESLHHRHQRSELREALHQDSEKALLDNQDIEREQFARVLWLAARMNDLTVALHSSSQAHEIVFVAPYVKTLPAYPAWEAARSSNLVDILPQQDITAYAEASAFIDALTISYRSHEIAHRRLAFEERFRVPSPGGGLDFSTATRQDLMEQLSLLSEERSNALGSYSLSLGLRGCLTAVLSGERNLDRIDDNENHVVDSGMKRLDVAIQQQAIQNNSPLQSSRQRLTPPS